ncbi:MAG: FaeA/PapI family transcriptional regulator [Candidatus Bathyarchaeia archaeon]
MKLKCSRCGRVFDFSKYNEHIKIEERKAEKEILKFIRKEKMFTTREIVEISKLSARQVKKILESFEVRGMIERVGQGVWKSL